MTSKITNLSALRPIPVVLLLFSILFSQTEMSAQWSPAELSTEVWLDASDTNTIQIDVDTITGWTDISSASLGNLTSTGNPLRVQNAQNGLNAIYFDGFVTSQAGAARDDADGFPLFGGNTASTIEDDFTVFIVAKAEATHEIDTESNSGTAGLSGQRFILKAHQYSGGSAGVGLSFGTNGLSVYEHAPGYIPAIAVYEAPSESQLTGYRVLALEENNRTPSLYVDGTWVHTGLTSTLTSYLTNKVGTSRQGGFVGEIGEVVIVGSVLAENERKKMEGYLAHKWGLTANLPADHVYSLNEPITASEALDKIHLAAVNGDASGITLADIASVDGFPHPIVQENLSIYQDVISSASNFANASDIIAAFTQKVLISAGEVSNADLPVTFELLYPASDFDESDITVSNGTLSSFSSTNGSVYTAVLTASPDSQVTVDIAADTFTSDVSGDNNVASKQFVWTYGISTSSSNIIGDLLLSQTSALTMSPSATIDGDVTITNGGSLIAIDGTITGTVSYTRTVPTDNWYLISSPVSGQDIDTFVSTSDLATGTVDSNNIGFSNYDNNTGVWSYYQSGTTGSGNFAAGQGHAIKLNAPGSVSFTGGFHNSDISFSLTSGTLNGYNLIGNPYLASVSVGELLGDNVNALSESTVWLWDQSADAYVEKNLAEDMEIAPGQGFFISFDPSNGITTFDIPQANQSHSTEDTFKTATRSKVELSLNNGELTRKASVFYIEGTTEGFDNGYDSSIFEGLSDDFALYTHAVANGAGRNLGIQSLPDTNYENMVVPVGVRAASGSNLEFMASAENFPEDTYVYIEDKETNSFARIDNDRYSVSLQSALDGVGRFYLHTVSTLLGAPNEVLEHISVYASNNETLHIEGIHQGQAQIRLYNLLGEQLIERVITATGNNRIALPKLHTGIYLVEVQNVLGVVNKKIIIK